MPKSPGMLTSNGSIEKSCQVKIAKVEKREILEQIYRLRYKVICEELQELDASDFPEGLEYDEYDEYADQYAIFNRKGELIGCFRLIYRCPLGLPAAKVFELNGILDAVGRDNICEISRISIEKEHRSLQNTIDIFTRIMVFGCMFMRKKRMDHALCAVEESLYRLLRISNAPFEKVGEPKRYYVRDRFPLLLSMRKLAEIHPKYCRYHSRS